MKKTIQFLVVITISLTSLLFACKKDNSVSPTENNLGTYSGTLQVADDPQTQLGYIYNAKVSVLLNGNNVTIKITGGSGFDREYTGTLISHLNDMYTFSINKQTKPSEKTAGDRLQISGNQLVFQVLIANDNISAIKANTTSQTIQITGKLSVIGTTMLKD
jgi:hypothetical protein